ncbi:MAG: SDR family oxidoreductase [Deinococcus sp.]|nr:SDR family oxidoreductase [Deinococcus sp.]
MPNKRLESKSAVVTGAGSGIGRAIAQLFAQEGAVVIAVDQNQLSCQETVQLMERAGGRGYCIQADVSSASDVERMVREATQAVGRLHILVNNAGIYRRAPVQDMAPGDWDLVMAVNLKGTFLCTRAVLPQLMEQRAGRIISIASRAGRQGEPSASAYAASKAGVIAFSASLAGEVRDYHITVNAICPGGVDTPMAKVAPVLPGSRLVPPVDIAQVALFLASDESQAITGAAIEVYG